jgi:superfamily II DNA or RNA helicase
MSGESELIPGAYARLLDEELKSLLDNAPELAATIRKIDNEEEPVQYALLLAQLLHAAIRQADPTHRIELLNRLIEVVAAQDGLDYLLRRKLLGSAEMVTSIHLDGLAESPWPLPQTALNTSYLFTGASGSPRLDHEISQEMRSADRVDVLVSFIKFSGLRLLMPAFKDTTKRNIPVRIITTSYMGASDPDAIAWLVRQPNVKVKVSYDTEHTRLHAKAYQFYRSNGYSTAYIGSANISKPAITSGLEWTVKITEQDQRAVMLQFRGEFESYWEQENFEACNEDNLERFNKAITVFRSRSDTHEARFLATITPLPFQERILEKLQTERALHHCFRNLVVAATGTGKTVIAAFDYARFDTNAPSRPRLLFLAHRVEILEQARDCFRSVLRDYNFGDILGGRHQPAQTDYLFCTVASANSKDLIRALPANYYSYLVVDEAHHGEAPSYKPIYDHFSPQILLGLTATPERMDGQSILPEYDNRITAEIRLPEALAERLLCPFHYFGITDQIALTDDSFWQNGKYSTTALTQVYTGDDFRALQRVDAVFCALDTYNPVDKNTRAIGFCVSVKHAEYMAKMFKKRGYSAETLLGTTPTEERPTCINRFRNGKTQFLFTVDVLNEGFDLPSINLVLFLRPTQSLTVFLQQLGRGLRHAPDKDCLTVIDMVGQQHRKYRIDRKFAALLPRQRLRLDKEAKADFPHLPAGCNIQLERVARQHVIDHIEHSLHDLATMVSEGLSTQATQLSRVPSLAEFLNEHDVDPLLLLKKDTWTGWKARSGLATPVDSPDQVLLQKAMARLIQRDSPSLLNDMQALIKDAVAEPATPYRTTSEVRGLMLYYLLNNKKPPNAESASLDEIKQLLVSNPRMADDLRQIAEWKKANSDISAKERFSLPFDCPLDLHAAYSSTEIKAAMGLATLSTSGPVGVGVLHVPDKKAYIHLVTFNKSENDFSPTTRYHDYLLNRHKLHWESQANTTQMSPTGHNYIHFIKRGYTILFFARINKKVHGLTAPFMYLGPAKNLLHFEGNRPIKLIWELEQPVTAAFYEEAKFGG